VVYDEDNKPRVFENIIWRSSYDFFDDSLFLYRSIQVPVIKVFGENAILPGLEEMVEVPEEEEKFLDRWGGDKLPKAVTITISFAQPYQAVTGELDVLESEKITRTIAIDRTRKLKYRFVARDLEPIDPNDLLDDGFDDTDTDELPDVKEEKGRERRRGR